MKKYIIYVISILFFVMSTELSIAQGDSLYFQKVRDASGNEQPLGACSRIALQQNLFPHGFNLITIAIWLILLCAVLLNPC